MKLNIKLLIKIKDTYAIETTKRLWYQLRDNNSAYEMAVVYDEICRLYSEQIIKCEECNGSGQREINVDGMDGPTTCIFCEGKGYQE